MHNNGGTAGGARLAAAVFMLMTAGAVVAEYGHAAAAAKPAAKPARPAAKAVPAAAAPAKSTSAVAAAPEFKWRKLANNTFKVGEKLHFDVSWKGFSVGDATFDVLGMTEKNGRKAYRLFLEAKSHGFFDKIYKVRNTDESWMDAESLCTLRFERHHLERKWRGDTITEYDPPARTCRTDAGPESKTEEFAQDIVSAFYYFRTLPLEVGKKYSIPVYSGQKFWVMEVLVEKIETVKIRLGKFETFKIKPMISGEGLFQSRGGITIWLTTDARRLPVKMRSEIPVGACDAQLTQFTAP